MIIMDHGIILWCLLLSIGLWDTLRTAGVVMANLDMYVGVCLTISRKPINLYSLIFSPLHSILNGEQHEKHL